eukprot:Gb_23920 [translate_table: standard]
MLYLLARSPAEAKADCSSQNKCSRKVPKYTDHITPSSFAISKKWNEDQKADLAQSGGTFFSLEREANGGVSGFGSLEIGEEEVEQVTCPHPTDLSRDINSGVGKSHTQTLTRSNVRVSEFGKTLRWINQGCAEVVQTGSQEFGVRVTLRRKAMGACADPKNVYAVIEWRIHRVVRRSGIREVTRDNPLDAPLLKSPKRGGPDNGKNYGPQENKRSGDRVYRNLGVWDCQNTDRRKTPRKREQVASQSCTLDQLHVITSGVFKARDIGAQRYKNKMGREEEKARGREGRTFEKENERGAERRGVWKRDTEGQEEKGETQERKRSDRSSTVSEATLQKPELSGEQCRASNVRQHREVIHKNWCRTNYARQGDLIVELELAELPREAANRQACRILPG